MYKMDRLGSGQLHLRDLKRQACQGPSYKSLIWNFESLKVSLATNDIVYIQMVAGKHPSLALKLL